jgi:hypothetical protein
MIEKLPFQGKHAGFTINVELTRQVNCAHWVNFSHHAASFQISEWRISWWGGGEDGAMDGDREWGPLAVAAMPALEGARLARLSEFCNQIARAAWLWHVTGLKPWGFRQRIFPKRHIEMQAVYG